MKKTEYLVSAVPKPEEKLAELSSEKVDDSRLPEFSKEVPISSRKTENSEQIQVDYEWKDDKSELIKVKTINFSKEENLDDFYRVNARDGIDSVCIKHNRATYILRKTGREIAHALNRVQTKLSSVFNRMVGYVKTVIGNYYLIAKVEGVAWSFDRRITRSNNIQHVDIDNIPESGKKKLGELISERLSEAHADNFAIGAFTMNNLLLTEDDLKFTDLRNVRVSRKRAYLVEEFKNVLSYLTSVGMIKGQDIYPCIATYVAKNENAAMEWFASKNKKKNVDLFEVASKIEQEVYC
ncbi:hypothetical protein HY988_02015 [Candidatus Micrarchaeota archaeon]|nr:hypothetical protein [Candidatus Micrarchaeota archaeon]